MQERKMTMQFQESDKKKDKQINDLKAEIKTMMAMKSTKEAQSLLEQSQHKDAIEKLNLDFSQ